MIMADDFFRNDVRKPKRLDEVDLALNPRHKNC